VILFIKVGEAKFLGLLLNIMTEDVVQYFNEKTA
jgi:hypothetical protein